MSNQEPTPIHTEQDPAQALERVEINVVSDDNVIQFPIARQKNPADEFVLEEQGEIVDQADPVNGVSRDEIAEIVTTLRDHKAYLDSVDSINASIEQTLSDKDREALRQADFLNSDRTSDKATAKSERSFDDVENLRRPAGAPAASIGSTALKIIVR